MTDCHGDIYSSFMTGGVVYVAGHSHYCGNMGGGFPQYPHVAFQHALAWTDAAGGDILNEVHGYPNWHGVEAGPSMVNWLPDMAHRQRHRSVPGRLDRHRQQRLRRLRRRVPDASTASAQQGLVRFAKRTIAPKTRVRRFADNALRPDAGRHLADLCPGDLAGRLRP